MGHHQDSEEAKEACELVLKQVPENTKVQMVCCFSTPRRPGVVPPCASRNAAEELCGGWQPALNLSQLSYCILKIKVYHSYGAWSIIIGPRSCIELKRTWNATGGQDKEDRPVCAGAKHAGRNNEAPPFRGANTFTLQQHGPC